MILWLVAILKKCSKLWGSVTSEKGAKTCSKLADFPGRKMAGRPSFQTKLLLLSVNSKFMVG